MKTILQCSYVCKSWRSNVKNPDFLSSQLLKTLNSEKKFIFFHPYNLKTWKNHWPLRFDDSELSECMLLRPPFDPLSEFEIVGSCNGLICFFHNHPSIGEYGYYRFVLWNPFLSKSFLLPSPPIFPSSRNIGFKYSNFVGFGFDSRSRDFKVLRILSTCSGNYRNCGSELCSLKSNSWKVIGKIPWDWRLEQCNYRSFGNTITPSVYVNNNNALHWIASIKSEDKGDKNFVAVFDLAKEIFRSISLPDSLANEKSEWRLAVIAYGASIAVSYRGLRVSENLYDIWILKKRGWMRLGTFGSDYRKLSKVLLFSKNGDAVIQVQLGGFASQKPRNRLRNLAFLGKVWANMCSYGGSLALLDKGDDSGVARYSSGRDDMSLVRKRKCPETTN